MQTIIYRCSKFSGIPNFFINFLLCALLIFTAIFLYLYKEYSLDERLAFLRTGASLFFFYSILCSILISIACIKNYEELEIFLEKYFHVGKVFIYFTTAIVFNINFQFMDFMHNKYEYPMEGVDLRNESGIYNAFLAGFAIILSAFMLVEATCLSSLKLWSKFKKFRK